MKNKIIFKIKQYIKLKVALNEIILTLHIEFFKITR